MFKNDNDSIKKDFAKYLDTLGLSPKSHKNYRSDLSHFLGWAILKIRSFGSYVENMSEVVPFLNTDLAKEYKNYMTENGQPPATVNRRLSTLRHLSRFFLTSQIMDQDFTQGLENVSMERSKEVSISPIINDFRSYLEAEKVSHSTVKNYMSDVRQFIVWLETNSQVLKSSN